MTTRESLKAQALKVLLDADEAHAPEGPMWPELAEAIVDAGWRPPSCSCGEPGTYGLGSTRVVHRANGPCTMHEVPEEITP
jgi:hypothetical protein